MQNQVLAWFLSRYIAEFVLACTARFTLQFHVVPDQSLRVIAKFRGNLSADFVDFINKWIGFHRLFFRAFSKQFKWGDDHRHMQS